MTSVYVYIDDRPTTDLASWKILNGHIPATGHTIHFTYMQEVAMGLPRSTHPSILQG